MRFKTALRGKDTTLAGELVMLPLPTRQIQAQLLRIFLVLIIFLSTFKTHAGTCLLLGWRPSLVG